MRWLSVLLLLGACGDLPRSYPRWVQTDDGIAWRGCAGVRAFVRKSGKQGIGVTLEVRARQDCPVSIAHAGVVLEDGTHAPGDAPTLDGLSGRSLVYLWMPVRFDGDRAWNDGARQGRLEIDLTIDGAAQPTIALPLREEPS